MRCELIMKLHLPIRFCLGSAFVLLSAAAPAFARGLKPPPPPPPPKVQRAQPPNTAARPEPRIAAKPAENQEHLQQWMDHHSNLSLPDQQRALQNESGFRDLPPQVQQHELNELARLYNMDPQQRARMLNRNEALERLTPPQRQQWRIAVEQLNTLPPDRRRVMTRVILDLREMPPDQRQLTLNSPAFRAQFSDSERTMLSTILTVEPYTPHPPTPAPAP
jgi:Protein of unknown function (DUF3106)